MTEISAMQKWLALEHEAVWLLPVVGSRLPELQKHARRAYATHLAIRDVLLARLHDAGADPVATALSYDIGPMTTNAEAQKVVRRVEARIAAACLTLVGDTSGKSREFATAGVRRAALAELDWGGAPTAFPGLP